MATRSYDELRQEYRDLRAKLGTVTGTATDPIEEAGIHARLCHVLLDLQDWETALWHLGLAVRIVVTMRKWDLLPELWELRDVFSFAAGMDSLTFVDVTLTEAVKAGHGPPKPEPGRY